MKRHAKDPNKLALPEKVYVYYAEEDHQCFRLSVSEDGSNLLGQWEVGEYILRRTGTVTTTASTKFEPDGGGGDE